MAIKKNDIVIVLTGKDRGKTGKVLESFPRISKVLVEGINVYAKRERPRRQGQKGQVVSKPMPIHISNVMLESEKKAKKPAKK
jgi:large subunit ribosomal protein L24